MNKKTIKQNIFGVSEWFFQDKQELLHYKYVMVKILRHLSRPEKVIKKYEKAYDYFTQHPKKYDGSTFVSDLFLIKLTKKNSFGKRLKLSFDSMLHDYESISGANMNYVKWFISAWDYMINLRANGKGWRWIRFIGLLILGVFFVPYKNIKSLKR